MRGLATGYHRTVLFRLVSGCAGLISSVALSELEGLLIVRSRVTRLDAAANSPCACSGVGLSLSFVLAGSSRRVGDVSMQRP